MPDPGDDADRALAVGLWASLGGDPAAAEALVVSGRASVLPSAFAVTPVAVAVVAAASLAVAEHAHRVGGHRLPAVEVDRTHATLAMRSEAALLVDGVRPQVWAPLTADYRSADGWVRIHANYPWHRRAAEQALGLDVDASSADVAGAVAARSSDDVESAVVEAGGAAAALRSAATWADHAAGRAVGGSLVGQTTTDDRGPTDALGSLGSAGTRRSTPDRPLGGVRVLDLTRVLAGPVATKVLAAYGADVLRVDPPGFDEVGVAADMTLGKATTALDLRTPAGRDILLALVAEADVVVHGYRPGALEGLGLGTDVLRSARPGLVVGDVSAWGHQGPWARRRGFDSLVQMAGGIAEEGGALAGGGRPRPLPCQLLDHASGWLLAAGVLRALTDRRGDGRGRSVSVALARTGAWLQSLPRSGDPATAAPADDVVAGLCETRASTLGQVRFLRLPGRIAGVDASWTVGPSPLGAGPPAFRVA